MAERKKQLSEKEKKILRNVLNKCKSDHLERPMERASELTGVPVRTLYRVCSTNGKEKRKRTKKGKLNVDDFDKGVIRRTVNELYGFQKKLPTLNLLLHELKDRINLKGSKSSLRKILKGLGFSWKRCQQNRKILMERTDIVAWRISYLKTIARYREEGRTIIFMDETFVNSAHHVPKCWQDEQTSLKVPIGKGDRFIIVHAGSEKGFVENAELVFKAKSSTGDYHSEMNSKNFEKWALEKLVPNIPPGSVIVLDNAPYHTVQDDKCPTVATKKDDIIQWMKRHSIPVPDDKPLKATLLGICKLNKPKPSFRVEEIFSRYGHKTLRLPPYHADLNPIELIWANLKNFVARHNITFKMTDVKALISDGFRRIGVSEWEGCCRKVKEIEATYRASDIAVDKELEDVVITLDSSTDTDFDGVYIESSSESTDTADEMH